MFILAAEAAEAATTVAASPAWIEVLKVIGQLGAGVGAIVLLGWYLWKGLPNLMAQQNKALDKALASFESILERQDARHTAQESEWLDEMKLTREQSVASVTTNVKLQVCMENLGVRVEKLNGHMARATGSFPPAAAKAKKQLARKGAT